MAESAQLLNPGGASSSISYSKLEEPDHSSSNWYFTREAIERSSPSRKDGIDLKKETYLRKSYCTFLQDLGMRLKVPQVTIATAIVFSHRFFLRQSHHKNDRYMIATVCMFLAGKVEETPKPLRDVIYLSYEIRFKKDPAAVQRIKQKEVYEQQKELVLLGERLVLSTLGFDLNIHHPYKPLVAAIKKFKVAQNALAQVAWNFVNDGLRTSLCLQFKPHHIAAGAIFLAAKFLKVKLPSDENKVWWQEFDVTPRQLEEVSNQMLELYEQNREVPASRASDPSASADASKQLKLAPIPPKAGEAQVSANGPACAPGNLALQQEAILRREDGQVPSRSGLPSVSNQAVVGKGQLQEAGSKEPRYGTKPVPSGSMRLTDDAGRSTTFTEVKQFSGVNEPGKEQVYVGVPFQQVSLSSRSIDNGVMKHGSPMEHETVRDMAGKYDANDVSNHRMSRFSEEDQKYNAGDTRVVDGRFAAGTLNTDDERYVVQNDSVSNGFGQNRQEFSERHESLQVGAKADIKVTGADKLKLGVDDREEKKNLPSFDGMPNIKAALEKRRKLKEENLEGRLVVSKAELTDEEELLERELEFGVEAAVKEERTKQDRKDNRANLLQRHEHEDWQPQRELNEDNEGGNKRKRLYEESQYSERKTKPHERADSFEGEHETLKDGLLDHTEDGELHGAAGQEQVISTRTDKRNHQASSPLWKRDHGSRDIHGHRDGSYDNKQRGHNRDYYHQPNSQHSHRVDGEKEHRHHKDRERQDREHKKARYDYGK